MFLLLFLIWIILNGSLSLQVLGVGAAVSAALTWASRRVLNLSPWGGVRPLGRRLPKVLFYLPYLVGQVAAANWQVLVRILCPRRRRGAPRLVWFDCGLGDPAGRLMLANSITLTPGTVTLSLRRGRLCVYALDQEFAAGLKDTGFARRLRRWEEGDHG